MEVAPQAKRLSESVLEQIRLANDHRRPSHAVADVYGLLEHIAYLEAAAAAQKEQVRELVEALQKISEGRGRFSMDPHEHACNTIDDMKAIATAALAALTTGETDAR